MAKPCVEKSVRRYQGASPQIAGYLAKETG